MKLLLALALLCAAPVSAEGFYVYGAFGLESRFDINKSERDANSAAAFSQPADSSFVTEAGGGKLQIGYRVNPTFSAEAGWSDFGGAEYHSRFSAPDFINPPNSRAGFIDENLTVRGPNLSVVATAPIAGRFSVFGRAGAIKAKTTYTQSANLTPGGTSAISTSESNWSPLYGAGVMFELPGRLPLAFRLEYEAAKNVGSRDVETASFGVLYGF